MRAHDRFVSINGLRLHYREAGEPAAPAVVLLHGGSAHAHWWDLFVESVADRYHVYALDLRGHGDSEHAEPPAYLLDDYTRDLAAFVDSMGLARPALIGHSLGGLVATAYAVSAPDRIRSLVVVDTSLRITPAGARYMARLKQLPHPIYRSRDDAVRRFRLLPTHTAADSKILEHIAVQGIRQLPDGSWTLKFDREAMAQNQPQDLTGELHRLRCPILFVRAGHSTLLTPAALAALLKAAPHAEAVEIAGAHHHVMLDDPPAFAHAVRAFLDRQHSEH